MIIMLDPRSSLPIYEQIIQQVRSRILQGLFEPGDKVPSVREMSSQLTVNPNTVSKAYKELERMEIFVTYRGKGTFINESAKPLIVGQEEESIKERVAMIVSESKQAGIPKEKLLSWVNHHFKEDRGSMDD